MLVLRRKIKPMGEEPEAIAIFDTVTHEHVMTVYALAVEDGKMKLGFSGPSRYNVVRTELLAIVPDAVEAPVSSVELR